jgi:hypothetical protein
MLLPGALFALFITGFWLYCLTDAILTPAPDCRGLSKRVWVAVIAVTFVAGAFAWLIARRPAHDPARVLTRVPDDSDDQADDVSESLSWTDADDAAARHPAGRGRVSGPGTVPKGPDDDQKFLNALDQAIRRNPPVGLLARRPVGLLARRSSGATRGQLTPA